MQRAFIAASILTLTTTIAQAAYVIDVKYDDLDLSKPSDVHVLEARAHQAATKLCAPLQQSYVTSLDYRIWYKGCMRSANVEAKRWVEAKAGPYRAFASN